MRIKILAPFNFGGRETQERRYAAGEILELDDPILATAFIASGRAELSPAPAPKPIAEPIDEPLEIAEATPLHKKRRRNG
jgi:hypothetical protein